MRVVIQKKTIVKAQLSLCMNYVYKNERTVKKTQVLALCSFNEYYDTIRKMGKGGGNNSLALVFFLLRWV